MSGFSTVLLRELIAYAFSAPGAQRIVVQPDTANHRAMARARKAGFILGEPIRVYGRDYAIGVLDRPAAERGRSRGATDSAACRVQQNLGGAPRERS